jgi:hypothetical protein
MIGKTSDAMTKPGIEWPRLRWFGIALLVFSTLASGAATPPKAACMRVVFEAEVTAGGYWTIPLGEGWVFRVVPITPLQAAYSGWDLVVDRQPPAGFPDALLLATMPYNSINEREIGTTFGLRAQDAIGWNPRSFRFITSPGDFREARQLFQSLTTKIEPQSAPGGSVDPKQGDRQAMARLLAIREHAATGEFRIVDAHIVAGVGDPAPYAQTWAVASSRTPHTVEDAPGGKSSALGAMTWMRFAVTLWLPAGWVVPASVHGQRMACPD